MATNLAELLRAQLGVDTTEEENALISSVGLTALRVVANRPYRAAFTIINTSVNNVFISPNNLVSTTRGILLGPNGGAYQAIWSEDLALVGKEWWCIGDAAGSTLYVLEYLIISPPGA